jgi:hypothetical protein
LLLHNYFRWAVIFAVIDVAPLIVDWRWLTSMSSTASSP